MTLSLGSDEQVSSHPREMIENRTKKNDTTKVQIGESTNLLGSPKGSWVKSYKKWLEGSCIIKGHPSVADISEELEVESSLHPVGSARQRGPSSPLPLLLL